MTTKTDIARDQAEAQLAQLVNELIVYDVPQYCGECGSFCDQTVLGEAVNTGRDANALFDTQGRDAFYGEPCGSH